MDLVFKIMYFIYSSGNNEMEDLHLVGAWLPQGLCIWQTQEII